MKRFIVALLGLSCFLLHNFGWAAQLKTVVVKKETADFDLMLKYPQGFADKNIDEAVQTLVTASQEVNTEHDDSSGGKTGKNSLFIDYKTMFQNKNALSLLFTISLYRQGAAHPENTVKTLNFIQGQAVTLAHLFVPNSNYMNQLVTLSRHVLTGKKISDRDWLIKGTIATAENYKNWYFTQKGLVLVFDTYQVAPYAYGPQIVEIAKSNLTNWLRPDVTKAVWGNQ